jgi:rhombotail lipoprotein
MGCELLLLYHVSDSGVDNYTDAAALYWTFVGLWLAPGNLYEHRTVMQAIIVDCRTGVILGTATGDSHLRAACPAAFGKVQEDKLAQEAWQKAMDDLLKACKPVLKAIVSKAAQPRR